MSLFNLLGKDAALDVLGVKLATYTPSNWQRAGELLHGALPAAAVGGLTYAATDDPLASAVMGLGAGGLGYAGRRLENRPLERELANLIPMRDEMGTEFNAVKKRLGDANNALNDIPNVKDITPEEIDRRVNELTDAATARGAWRAKEPIFNKLDHGVAARREFLDSLLG